MAARSGRDERKRFIGELEAPAFVRTLLRDPARGWIWLAPRFLAGWLWLEAGWRKLMLPSWTGNDAGAAISHWIQTAAQKAAGPRPVVHDWYASFLQSFVLPHAVVWSYVVTWGEIAVALGLLFGGLTAVAGLFSALMNVNYLMGGATSTNPELLVVSVLIMAAWRTSGSWGLDRWLLPALGTPWQPGFLFGRRERAPLSVSESVEESSSG